MFTFAPKCTSSRCMSQYHATVGPCACAICAATWCTALYPATSRASTRAPASHNARTMRFLSFASDMACPVLGSVICSEFSDVRVSMRGVKRIWLTRLSRRAVRCSEPGAVAAIIADTLSASAKKQARKMGCRPAKPPSKIPCESIPSDQIFRRSCPADTIIPVAASSSTKPWSPSPYTSASLMLKSLTAPMIWRYRSVGIRPSRIPP
mmetsp:Transcript_74543/g.212526  ORF Transcript_74543/g.212526 Transcript_74543/m.212526 type:complete len:208 (-) Transcript_74543:367-990(-)